GFSGGSVSGIEEAWSLSLTGTPTWTRIEPLGMPPAARERPVVIYDPVRDRALLFGGAGTTYMNDVWELSLDSSPEWKRVTYAGTPPSPRGSHSAVYDPVRDRLVIFGGNTLESWNNNDTWALSLGGVPTWTQIASDGTQPPERSMAAAVYDAPRDRMVI